MFLYISQNFRRFVATAKNTTWPCTPWYWSVDNIKNRSNTASKLVVSEHRNSFIRYSVFFNVFSYLKLKLEFEFTLPCSKIGRSIPGTEIPVCSNTRYVELSGFTTVPTISGALESVGHLLSKTHKMIEIG